MVILKSPEPLAPSPVSRRGPGLPNPRQKDSIIALTDTRVKPFPIGFAHRSMLKPVLISSADNAELFPAHPSKLYGVAEFTSSEKFLQLGNPGTVSSPYRFDLLLQDLSLLSFPNLAFASSVLTGFRIGFHLNITNTALLKQTSSYANPPNLEKVIQLSHAKDIAKQRSWSVPQEDLKTLHCLSILPQFTVPQKDKHRVISDAKRSGLNNCIDVAAFGVLKMDTVPALLQDILSYPPASDLYLLTEDCSNYFRNFPLALPDRAFTLLESDRTILVDGRLPFGVCSAPILTHQFLDLFCWVVRRKFRVKIFHYSDNLFLVVQGQLMATQVRKTILSYCEYLGITLNPRDSQCSRKATVLGIEIDAVARYAAVPAQKRHALLLDIQVCLQPGLVSAKTYATLVSRLIWYSCIIIGGMAHAVTLWKHQVSGSATFGLPTACRESLLWFQRLLFQWDGVFYFDLQDSVDTIADLSTASDSSPEGASILTACSYTAWSWCQCCWLQSLDISCFELASLLIGLSTFLGSQANRKVISWFTDSESALHILTRGYSGKNLVTNDLLQEILLSMSKFHTRIVPRWVPREELQLVDSLSRGNLSVLPPLADGRAFMEPQGCFSIRPLDSPYVFGFVRNHPVRN